MQRAEIVVVHLLATWRGSTEKRTPGENEVKTIIVEGPVHQEIFLLRSKSGGNKLGIYVSKSP